jgi:hypothetical protein
VLSLLVVPAFYTVAGGAKLRLAKALFRRSATDAQPPPPHPAE